MLIGAGARPNHDFAMRFEAMLVLLLGAAVRPAVTPVHGPSWIQRIGLALDDTRLGKMGADGAPPASAEQEPTVDLRAGAPRQPRFRLGGEDLYRLNCRACHGPDGRGAPPEINSLIGPIQATSPTVLEERQRAQGRVLSPAMARELAAQADGTIRERLAHGGKEMPAFPHLADDEVSALLAYLKVLAHVPNTDLHPIVVMDSALRVGEHLVKGTCNICHPATGPAPNPMMMYMQGVIPSLAGIADQWSSLDVVRKVRRGYTMMPMMARMARMPVFGYLTEQEVLAAVLYIRQETPQP